MNACLCGQAKPCRTTQAGLLWPHAIAALSDELLIVVVIVVVVIIAAVAMMASATLTASA